ncbi:hypothetical protein DRE_04655 [Drechslerella stenobrocha 248]|uniref:Uncharacterized protein n=1 Tax=Drechslerella stenobrocha 248 TaxID=1043628 RepID=W7HPN2_9PEZI|nr:hypothetical protein DRE_04655 [Drechslerella stenobrocha 248]
MPDQRTDRFRSAAFQFTYSGGLDLEYFDAVIDDTDRCLYRLKNLAIIPARNLEKEKQFSGILADDTSWDIIWKTTHSNVGHLLGKLITKLGPDQLLAFQFDEPNFENCMFPNLRTQLRLRHLSVHDSFLVTHFATARAPPHLQSLVVHGIRIYAVFPFYAFLKHVSRYSSSLSYLGLNFANLLFPADLSWARLEVAFNSLPRLRNLTCLALGNCNDMTGLQFSTLAFIPYRSLRRLKIVSCRTDELGGILGMFQRMGVERLTHLNLTRTCSTREASQIVEMLEPGLQNVHLEFEYDDGRFAVQPLWKHRDTLCSIWLESSTGTKFEEIELEAGSTTYMREFTQFRKLTELAVAINYWSIDQGAIEWDNPPNLRILRILNLDEKYTHITAACEQPCPCRIAESFVRIHAREYTHDAMLNFRVIAFGKCSEGDPEVKPMYYYIKPGGLTPTQKCSHRTTSIAEDLYGKEAEEQQGGPKQDVEYDAGDEDDNDQVTEELPKKHRLILRGGADNSNDHDYEGGYLVARIPEPDDGLTHVIRSSLQELKSGIPQNTILDVDREGVPFWEKDDMIDDPLYYETHYRVTPTGSPGGSANVGSDSDSISPIESI